MARSVVLSSPHLVHSGGCRQYLFLVGISLSDARELAGLHRNRKNILAALSTGDGPGSMLGNVSKGCRADITTFQTQNVINGLNRSGHQNGHDVTVRGQQHDKLADYMPDPVN